MLTFAFVADHFSTIQAIRLSSSGEIFVMGRGKLLSSLIDNNLLDELCLITIPTMLGKRMPFGADVAKMSKTTQVESKGITTTPCLRLT